MRATVRELYDNSTDQSWIIAHLVGKMTLVKNGKLVATNVHDKVSVDPQAVRFSQHSKL